LHSEGLQDLYSSPNVERDQIKEETFSGSCGVSGGAGGGGEDVFVQDVGGGHLKERRQIRRLRRGSEDRIKMDLKEIGREFVGWIVMAQDTDRWRFLVKTAMNF
jgi:hypothetical protein